MVCRRYRPRQPRSSPVWQVFRQHWPAYLLRQEAGISAKHGPLAAQVPSAVAAFLRCGDLHAGFTRLRCPECEHEYLLAFTCKQRGLCASCHQRRTLVEAAFIADEVCAAVPHRHLVLTVPRLLRGHFAGRPARLGELALAARDAITAWLRERTGCPAGQPGLVMVVQTFGDFLLWHVPAKGVPSVRYYGWYSNKSRGLRRKATAASTTAPAEPGPLAGTDPASLGCRSTALPAVLGIPAADRVDRDPDGHPRLP